MALKSVRDRDPDPDRSGSGFSGYRDITNVNQLWYVAVGSLVQCETCPAAYHAACLPAGEKSPTAKPPPARSGEWRCKRCRDGIESLYGDIVWVKFGSYRYIANPN